MLQLSRLILMVFIHMMQQQFLMKEIFVCELVIIVRS